MHLEIVSPEATLYTSEIESVILPGSNGEFQILNNHAAIVSTLQKGQVKIAGPAEGVNQEFDSKFNQIDGKLTLEINSGTIEMKNNRIIVLAD